MGVNPARGLSRRTGLLASMIAAAALAVAGCSAGQITQTDTQAAAVNGEQAKVGPLRIGNAVLSYPEGDPAFWAAGSNVPLHMSVVNTGPVDDEIVSLSSTWSDKIQVKGTTVLTARKELIVGGPKAAAETPLDEATDSGEKGNTAIVFTKVTKNLFPGQVIELEIVFRNAPPVTLRIPIEAPTEPRTAEEHPEGAGSH